MDRGNQYIQLVKVLYCKLQTNGKQLPAFPLEVGPGTEHRSQRWEARLLPLSSHHTCCSLELHAREIILQKRDNLQFQRQLRTCPFGMLGLEPTHSKGIIMKQILHTKSLRYLQDQINKYRTVLNLNRVNYDTPLVGLYCGVSFTHLSTLTLESKPSNKGPAGSMAET